MDVNKFLTRMGKKIVTIEVNSNIFHWQVPHNLLAVLHDFESCLTAKELGRYRDKINYLRGCLNNAVVKIRDRLVVGDMKVAVFENQLNELKSHS